MGVDKDFLVTGLVIAGGLALGAAAAYKFNRWFNGEDDEYTPEADKYSMKKEMVRLLLSSQVYFDVLTMDEVKDWFVQNKKPGSVLYIGSIPEGIIKTVNEVSEEPLDTTHCLLQWRDAQNGESFDIFRMINFGKLSEPLEQLLKEKNGIVAVRG
jgi:hypothetical protein